MGMGNLDTTFALSFYDGILFKNIRHRFQCNIFYHPKWLGTRFSWKTSISAGHKVSKTDFTLYSLYIQLPTKITDTRRINNKALEKL